MFCSSTRRASYPSPTWQVYDRMHIVCSTPTRLVCASARAVRAIFHVARHSALVCGANGHRWCQDCRVGVTWLWCEPELRVSVHHIAHHIFPFPLTGAARSARNLVLLGDQMQLPAPAEGHHPGTSGLSCLDYLLRGAQVVPPEQGVFLPTTYRMHPRLCSLVSELSYESCLLPHPCTARR